MVIVSYWDYQLHPKSALNALVSNKPRQGALLRLSQEGVHGYADLHPWPELGDEPLSSQLENLKQGRLNSQMSQTLRIALEDAQARSEGRSLFEGLTIPQSHWLCTDPAELDGAMIDHLLSKGFTRIKVKIGRSPREEAEKLAGLSLSNLLLRLDANSSFSIEEMLSFLKKLNSILDKVEFIEDPCPFDIKQWAALQEYIPLAADRYAIEALDRPEIAKWIVVKPAIMETPSVSCQKLTFTSYLDHPVGQLYAAYSAAKHHCQEVCGLLSHTSYQPDPFSSSLSNSGPRLIPPKGTGLGFDHLLEALPWKNLTAI